MWAEQWDVKEEWGSGDGTKAEMLAISAKIAEYASNPVHDDDEELAELVEELTDAAADGELDWFNAVWNALYDWADYNRVWIATF